MKISIQVKPNSKKGPLIESLSGKSFTIFIREIAADNQANEAVIKLLSKHFKIPKSNIKILRGHTSRHKIIEIEGI